MIKDREIRKGEVGPMEFRLIIKNGLMFNFARGLYAFLRSHLRAENSATKLRLK